MFKLTMRIKIGCRLQYSQKM